MGLLKTVLVDDESMVVYSVIFVGPKVYWKVRWTESSCMEVAV